MTTDISSRTAWPALRPRRLDRYPRHPAHVDADRREDPATARAAAQPLVAGDAVRHRQGADRVGNPVRLPGSSRSSSTSATTSCACVPATVVRARSPSSSKSVAEFYAQTVAGLGELGVEAWIQASPNEVVTAVPFAEDEVHASYDASAANLFWRQLVQADRVLTRSARTSSASARLCISSGARWIRPAPGSPGAARPSPRWCPELRGLGDGRGLFPRAEQLRVLARRRRGGRLLLLRIPPPDGFTDHPVGPRRRTTAPSWASSCCRTRPARTPPTRTPR